MMSIDDHAPPRPTRAPEVFSGWKEIANYFGKGVRTVQRYERDLKLPVHRPAGKSHAAVIATKTELDDWVAAGAKRSSRVWPGTQTNRNGADFLLIDSEIALTFSSMALGASDAEKRRRTELIARKAYDTITRLRHRIDLDVSERERLDANLERLQSELQQIVARRQQHQPTVHLQELNSENL
jgi:hypothetical protein